MDPTDPAGRAIYRAAKALNAGDAGALLRDPAADDALDAPDDVPPVRVRARIDAVAFAGPELLVQRAGFLDRWIAERVRGLAGFDERVRRTFRRGPDGFEGDDLAELAALFRHFESARLLCLTRGEAPGSGAAWVNARVHEALGGEHDGAWLPGEPVLMGRNDYDRGLFNGDGGLVLSVAGERGAAPMVVFPVGAGYEAFPLDPLRADLELAYAMTVHRSQGSEFDHVGVLLPDEDAALLTREIVYTAATRSRKAVTFVGDPALLLLAAGRPAVRHSGLGARLAAAEPA
jgi:exodeoxyribonuclease V alpha subunit